MQDKCWIMAAKGVPCVTNHLALLAGRLLFPNPSLPSTSEAVEQGPCGARATGQMELREWLSGTDLSKNATSPTGTAVSPPKTESTGVATVTPAKVSPKVSY